VDAGGIASDFGFDSLPFPQVLADLPRPSFGVNYAKWRFNELVAKDYILLDWNAKQVYLFIPPPIRYVVCNSRLCVHFRSFLVVVKSVPAVMACGWRRGGLPVFVGMLIPLIFMPPSGVGGKRKNGVFYEPPRRAMRSNRLVMVAQFSNSFPTKVVV
jgi:hypothetical protein